MYALPLKTVIPVGRARLGCAGSKGLSALPDGMATLGTEGGALNLPPQAVRARTMAATSFMMERLLEPDPRDHGDRGSGERVLEGLFEGLVAGAFFDPDVEPERPRRADAG